MSFYLLNISRMSVEKDDTGHGRMIEFGVPEGTRPGPQGRSSPTIPAPTVSLVASSIRMKLPVRRLAR
jgi:hypothetical protein